MGQDIGIKQKLTKTVSKAASKASSLYKKLEELKNDDRFSGRHH